MIIIIISNEHLLKPVVFYLFLLVIFRFWSDIELALQSLFFPWKFYFINYEHISITSIPDYFSTYEIKITSPKKYFRTYLTITEIGSSLTYVKNFVKSVYSLATLFVLWALSRSVFWVIFWFFSLLLSLAEFFFNTLYLYKSTIRSCMESCCYVWAVAPSCFLGLLDKLQKRICRVVSPLLAPSLEPSAHRWNVISLSLFCRYYFGRCSSELAQLVPLPYSRERSTRCSNRLPDFSVTIPTCHKDVYRNSFFNWTTRPKNSLPIECSPLTYDLNGFKSRIYRQLLTVGSFQTDFLYALIFLYFFFF